MISKYDDKTNHHKDFTKGHIFPFDVALHAIIESKEKMVQDYFKSHSWNKHIKYDQKHKHPLNDYVLTVEYTREHEDNLNKYFKDKSLEKAKQDVLLNVKYSVAELSKYLEK